MASELYQLLTGTIFALTYAAIIFRNAGRFSLPIWLILLGGAVAMVATGSIGVAQAYATINLPVITFLFSMFVIVTALDIAGVLDRFANGLLKRTRKPSDVLLLTFLGFAFASALLMNDTLAFAVTIGSVATPMGNPQNLLVALVSGIRAPVFSFARYLLIPTLVELLVTYALIRRLFHRETDRAPASFVGAKERLADDGPKDPRLAKVAVGATVMTLALIIAVNALQSAGYDPPFGISEVSLFGAAALLLAGGRSREITASLDWGILLMFAGLFVMMQALSANGVVEVIAGYLPALSRGLPAASIAAIIISGVLLSQLISNVPMVALYLPIMVSLGYGPTDAYAWTALAGGSTLAGNLTIIGAASNLIIIEQAEKKGERLSSTEFLRVGIPVTVLDVAVLYFLLFFGL